MRVSPPHLLDLGPAARQAVENGCGKLHLGLLGVATVVEHQRDIHNVLPGIFQFGCDGWMFRAGTPSSRPPRKGGKLSAIEDVSRLIRQHLDRDVAIRVNLGVESALLLLGPNYTGAPTTPRFAGVPAYSAFAR